MDRSTYYVDAARERRLYNITSLTRSEDSIVSTLLYKSAVARSEENSALVLTPKASIKGVDALEENIRVLEERYRKLLDESLP
jgi:hypothetical protein